MNTITAYFKGRIGIAESVYQNDYGIIMVFDGISLPEHFDCYFSVSGSDTAIPAVGTDNRVVIPNGVLANAGQIEVHIPLHTGTNDSEVEYVVYGKVIGRARPEDDGTPAQMTAIEQALALLQNPITNIEQIVNEALSFTGDTFAEMQAALDADQAAFQDDMGDRADAFEAEIRGDIADVESDFDSLNAQFQTAIGAVTVDDELLNVRVGDDNVTYATAGEAVRKQFSHLKSDIDYSVSYEYDFTDEIIQGSYIKTDINVGNTVSLTPVTNASFGHIIIPCMAGARFIISGQSGSAPRLWAFVDKDDKMLAFAASSITGSNLEVTAPSGTAKAIFNVALYGSYSIVQKNALLPVKDVVDSINSNIDSVENLLEYSKNITNLLTSGYYIKTDIDVGNVVSLTPVENVSFGYYIIPCKSGDKFIISGSSGSAPRLWAFIDADNKMLSFASSSVSETNLEVTAPSGTANAIFNVALYATYSLISENALMDVDNYVNEKTAPLPQIVFDSPQLFDRNTITENKAYSNDGQSIVTDNTKCLSDFIPVESGQAYTMLACVGRLLFFTASKEYLTAYSVQSYSEEQHTTAPQNAWFMRLEMNRFYYPYAQTMVVRGSNLTTDVHYGVSVDESKISSKKGYKYSAIPIPQTYSAIGVKAVDGTEDFDDDNPSVSQLYDAYDALMADFPNYITREDFGMDASNTYHMYAYYFTPEDVPTEYDMYRKPYPKVNLRSGIHGNGTLGDSNINCFCLYYLMKSICYNWRESEALEYLRWNVRFAILPLQNPWGFENKKRFNSNGVDINRNFSVGWQLGTSGNPDYGGASPLSESETNNIIAFEEANKDAIFTVDVHSQSQAPQQSQMSYMSVFATSEAFYPAKSLVTKISHVWDSQNIPNLQKMNFHGYVACEFTGWGTGTSYIPTMIGTPAWTLEGFKNFANSPYTDGSVEVVKMVADQLGYGVLLGLSHFK